MDEKRNSMKLDIEAVRLSDSENQQSKEYYKPIPEYPGKYHSMLFILNIIFTSKSTKTLSLWVRLHIAKSLSSFIIFAVYCCLFIIPKWLQSQSSFSLCIPFING